MWKPVLAALAIWTVVVGCCFWFNETPTRASENEMPAAPSGLQLTSSPIGIQPEPSAGQQMEALDRHARVRMICYPGQFGPSDMPVIALGMKAIKP